jgi:gliding motility-associated-like protein
VFKILTMHTIKQLLFAFLFVFVSCISVSASESYEVSNLPFMDTLDYNFFSPNGDDINDYYIIENLDQYREYNKFSVFNRWGDLVYEASPYLNDKENAWNGKSNQPHLGTDNLPEGVYFYRFEYKVADKTTSITGKILLKR